MNSTKSNFDTVSIQCTTALVVLQCLENRILPDSGTFFSGLPMEQIRSCLVIKFFNKRSVYFSQKFDRRSRDVAIVDDKSVSDIITWVPVWSCSPRLSGSIISIFINSIKIEIKFKNDKIERNLRIHRSDLARYLKPLVEPFAVHHSDFTTL